MEQALKESIDNVPNDLLFNEYHTEFIDPELDPEMYLAMLASQGIINEQQNKDIKSKNENIEKNDCNTKEEFCFYLGFNLNDIIKNPYQVITFKGYKLYL